MGLAALYRSKAETYITRRAELARVSTRISRLRLLTFLPAAVCVVWMLSRGFTPLVSAIAAMLFLAFGALVVWHARVEERMEWFDALRLVNERARARLERDWSVLPAAEAPAGVDLSHHPYALDLDLFGRASLYQWLGPAATPRGGAMLAAGLLAPAERHEISGRQEAIAELATADSWREELAARGVMSGAARQVEIDALLSWAEGSHPLGERAPLIHTLVWVITGSILVLGALHYLGVTDGAYWLIPLLAGVVLSFVYAWHVTKAFDRAGGGQQALRRYAGLFAHAESASSNAPLLREIKERLTAGGSAASHSMRTLNRILGFADLRRGAAIFHFVIQAFTLWDFHVLFALERWRRLAGARVRGWLEALAELDALSLLAAIQRTHPDWAVPDVTRESKLEATALGHPLIPGDRRVANDVTIGPPGTVLLVTGSNMSGKSTLLRAIGLNTVLAGTGAPVCASSFRLPQIDLQSSIRVQDSLELGLSYFMAALARLKGVVDAAEHEREGRVLLYLLDEILQGTNSAERSIAVRAVARHLLNAGAIGALTTHDLTLASEEPLDTAARLVHFTETVDPDGSMRFDYKLRPGLATSRNAIRLMQMIGIEP